MSVRVLAVSALLALSGCGSHVQTTSGATYLQKYAAPPTDNRIDGEVRQAAAVEPTLTFPARIGVARIEHGQLTPIPPAEAEEWMKLAQRLGPSWGEFVPVSPLVAKLASSGVGEATAPARPYGYQDALERVMRELRLGAGRQHVDVALIYEVRAKHDTASSALALADLTVIGAWLVPSRFVNARAVATALLVDVRNGYPYGFTDPVSDEKETFRPSMGSDQRGRELAVDAGTEATKKLIPEVEKLALKVRAELAERRLAANPR